MSTVVVLLLKGSRTEALGVDAFARVFPLFVVLLLIVSLLPDDLHHIVLHGITALEQLIGIVAFLLLGLTLYGVPPLYHSS